MKLSEITIKHKGLELTIMENTEITIKHNGLKSHTYETQTKTKQCCLLSALLCFACYVEPQNYSLKTLKVTEITLKIHGLELKRYEINKNNA